MSKKLSPDIDFSDEYSLLGIVCQLKDYRLAYFLNIELLVHLKKYDDLQLSEKGGSYPWFYTKNEENDFSVFLIANYHQKGKLIPAQKMDYFLLINNMQNSQQVNDYVIKIRKIPEVLAVFRLELSKINNLQLILEAVEMHEMDQVKKPATKRQRQD